VDETARLLEALGSVLEGIAWPLVVLIVLLFVKRSLDERGGSNGGDRWETAHRAPRNLVQRFVSWFGEADEATAKIGPIEVSRKIHSAAQSSAGLMLAEQQRSGSIPDVHGIAESVARAVESFTTKARGLWVDDKPDGNVHERAALEPQIDFTLVRSTDEAVTELTRDTYDVVITNWARPRDDDAALTLLDSLRDLADRPPVVIYAGRKDERREEAATNYGALGYTTQPREVYDLVTRAIAQRVPAHI
jgi:CheY-like chemotaxis protein